MISIGLIAKHLVRLVTSVSVGTVVANAVKNTSPAEMDAVQKVSVVIGSGILSSMVADKASDYVIEQINSLRPINSQVIDATKK